MKQIAHIMLAAIIGVTLIAPSLFAEDAKYSGFLPDQVYSRLQPGPEGGAKMRWINPAINPGKYKRFMVDSVVFFFAPDSEYKGIDPQEMKLLADSFNKHIVDALKDKYQFVSEPGPDVARISFAITGLKESKPARSGVSTILPVGLGISLIKKGTTGAWTGSGATAAEVIIRDSMTNEVIGAAVDDRSASFGERFSKWGSAEEAFKFWAQRLRAVLDQYAMAR